MGLSKYSQMVIRFLKNVNDKEGIDFSPRLKNLHDIVSMVYHNII